MSMEIRTWVRLPRTAAVDRLLKDAVSAQARLRKALPGDRVDAARYESLCTQIEQRAYQARLEGAEVTPPFRCGPGNPPTPGFLLTADAPDAAALMPAEEQRIRMWLAEDSFAVQLRFPFENGITPVTPSDRPPSEPAEPWEAAGGATGRRAVLQRFRAQVLSAAAGEPGASISPSGVSNSVLTDILREYSAPQAGQPPVLAKVAYRDGSAGPPFPLRGTPLVESPERPARQLSFALLSIRHTEMDIEVDGAWLRNTVVSRVRPAGDTDRIVYDLSLGQLRSLTKDGPLTIHMYHTGLETAVVGFYRAVVAVLGEPGHRPGALVVVPRYFRSGVSGNETPHFSEGTPWRT
jgi:hypothetical protein